LKNIDLEELEFMKSENQKRLRELEDAYYGKQENSQVGKVMRERMGLKDNHHRGVGGAGALGGTGEFEREDDEAVEDKRGGAGGVGKRKKSVKIVEEGPTDKENHDEPRIPKQSAMRSSIGGKPPSLSKSATRGQA